MIVALNTLLLYAISIIVDTHLPRMHNFLHHLTVKVHIILGKQLCQNWN